MHYLKNKFQQLQSLGKSLGNTFSVVTLPSIRFHKLGISEHGNPVFFIATEADDKFAAIDCHLDLIKIDYNRICTLIIEQKQRAQGMYTIVSLKASSTDIIYYFLDVMYLMLSNLPERVPVKKLKTEFAQLISLFSALSETPLKTIQGLWSELFLIQRASKPEYLINSWHVKAKDSYDFNDGKDKIEVKSTTQQRRVHTFSLEQLNPNTGAQLMVVSIRMYQSGSGKSVFDLLELIELKGISAQLIFSLREKVALCLGTDFEKAQEVYFDYNYAVDNILYYHAGNIPHLDKSLVPPNIYNIHFDCDLSSITASRQFSVPLHTAALYNT